VNILIVEKNSVVGSCLPRGYCAGAIVTVSPSLHLFGSENYKKKTIIEKCSQQLLNVYFSFGSKYPKWLEKSIFSVLMPNNHPQNFETVVHP